MALWPQPGNGPFGRGGARRIRSARDDHPAADAFGRHRCGVPRGAVPDGAGVRPAAFVPRSVRPLARSDGIAVHCADRRGLPTGRRRRVDPGAGRSHPTRLDTCDHRSGPADRQGPADQAAQHPRPPQRAGAAVGEGRGRHPRRQSAAAPRQRPAVPERVARGVLGGVARFLEKFARNSEDALDEIRRSDRERAKESTRAAPRRAGLKRPARARPLASCRDLHQPRRGNGEAAMSEFERWEKRFSGPELSLRNRAERVPQEQGASAQTRATRALHRRR